MRIDEQSIRDQLNRHLEGSRKGEAAQIAAAAGLSTSTVSRFRKETYLGDSEKVAKQLAEALESRIAAEDITSGRFRLTWLVNTRKGPRLVKKAETVEQILQQFPEAFVVQMWLGPEPKEIHFIKGARRTANDRSECSDPKCINGAT